jgi:hypothetical protein
MFKCDPSESSKILRVSPVFAHAPNARRKRARRSVCVRGKCADKDLSRSPGLRRMSHLTLSARWPVARLARSPRLRAWRQTGLWIYQFDQPVRPDSFQTWRRISRRLWRALDFSVSHRRTASGLAAGPGPGQSSPRPAPYSAGEPRSLYRGGVAVSRVGGAAEVDVKERKDRPRQGRAMCPAGFCFCRRSLARRRP